MLRRLALLLPPGLTALITLAACGAAPTVPVGTAEKAAEDALEKDVGSRPDVHCPHDLEARVGAQIRCTLTAEVLDGSYPVTVTVRSVDHGQARLDVTIGDQQQG